MINKRQLLRCPNKSCQFLVLEIAVEVDKAKYVKLCQIKLLI